jgi:hypothetical protein
LFVLKPGISHLNLFELKLNIFISDFHLEESDLVSIGWLENSNKMVVTPLTLVQEARAVRTLLASKKTASQQELKSQVGTITVSWFSFLIVFCNILLVQHNASVQKGVKDKYNKLVRLALRISDAVWMLIEEKEASLGSKKTPLTLNKLKSADFLDLSDATKVKKTSFNRFHFILIFDLSIQVIVVEKLYNGELPNEETMLVTSKRFYQIEFVHNLVNKLNLQEHFQEETKFMEVSNMIDVNIILSLTFLFADGSGVKLGQTPYSNF